MKFTDPFFRRSDLCKNLQNVTFAFHRLHDQFAGATVLLPLALQGTSHDRKLRAALAIERGVDNNDDFVEHGGYGGRSATVSFAKAYPQITQITQMTKDSTGRTQGCFDLF
jgi:hypothetical protein